MLKKLSGKQCRSWSGDALIIVRSWSRLFAQVGLSTYLSIKTVSKVQRKSKYILWPKIPMLLLLFVTALKWIWLHIWWHRLRDNFWEFRQCRDYSHFSTTLGKTFILLGVYIYYELQGSVVQSIVSLMSSLVTTNSLTVVAKVFQIHWYFCGKNGSSYSHFFS